jgi:SAM-dependent methyltransferase
MLACSPDGSPTECPACGARSFRLVFPGNIGRNVDDRFSQYAFYDDMFRCGGCGLLAQRQSKDTESIIRLLAAEKYLDETIGVLNLAEKNHQFSILIAMMRRHVSLAHKRVLDVGANTGVFLDLLKADTDYRCGIEPSKEAASAARERFGLNVQNAVIATARLPDQAFDVITMFDVVEHLTEPVSDFTNLRRTLKPGGRIFITTHDIDTLYARLLGKRYPMLMYQHFYHFSPETLAMLLRRAGLRVVATDRFFKSWSIAYLHELFGKKWPHSIVSKAIQLVSRPLLWSDHTRLMRVIWPIREFFMCVAERA